MESVCARRQLQCRLYVKNEAAAVEAHPDLVQASLEGGGGGAGAFGSLPE
jgi:hypothetical protein